MDERNPNLLTPEQDAGIRRTLQLSAWFFVSASHKYVAALRADGTVDPAKYDATAPLPLSDFNPRRIS